jgi:ELWxxDGT repeat protein
VVPAAAVPTNPLFAPIADTALWRSTGTAGSTVLVKDINPGTASSFAEDMTNFNGSLLFAANDGVHGFEPWVLGPVPASATATTALVVPPSLVQGPAFGFPRDASAPRLLLTALAGRATGALESGDSASPERLLLEDSKPVGAGGFDSARHSPAVLGRKSRPHLLRDQSEDSASNALVPLRRA